MNVANLELCKELYELSGWKDAALVLNTANGLAYSVDDYYGKFQETLHVDDTPLYDLGYLLRKLPGYLTLQHIDAEHSLDGDTFWKAVYQSHLKGKLMEAEGCDTPEDAAAKLAIDLFKQGVLNKKEDK